MKKQLLFLAAFCIAIVGVNAQILTDNIDSYTEGAIGPQSDHWTTWSGDEGGAEDGIVTAEQASSAPNSVLIAEGGAQDVVLLLGDSASGAYELSWHMYLPDSMATGYYNFQGSPTIGDDFIIEIYLNAGGAEPGVIRFGGNEGAPADYPVGEWFEIKHNVDLESDLMSVTINGAAAYSGPYTGATGNLSSIDFYSIDAANRYFIDDVNLDAAIPCPVPDAIICDNFESYEEDLIGPQSTIWTTWTMSDGGAEDAYVVSDYANSGVQSLVIEEGGTQDVVLLLGNQTEGRYSLSWNMLMEDSSQTAYYNIQGSDVIGDVFVNQFFINQDGENPGVYTVENAGSVNIPFEQWFNVEHIVDLDNDVFHVFVDGQLVAANVAITDNLSSIDFYSIDDNNRVYIDDVVMIELESVALCDPTDVIYCENFDGFLEGTRVGPYSDQWTTWSGDEGGAEDGLVSNEQAASAPNSMLIAEGGAQDVVFITNDYATGSYDVSWDMFIPTDSSTAYYNFQGDAEIGTDFVQEIQFNEDGTNPGVMNVADVGTATYPVGEWFNLLHRINLDTDMMDIYINYVDETSTPVVSGPFTGTTGNLSSVDFYSIDAMNRYYIDNVVIADAPVGITELGDVDFTIFPNPNNGQFTIVNDAENAEYSVVVTDLAGRTIYSEQYNMVNGQNQVISLEDVNTGIYLLQFINNDNATRRVTKMIVE